MGKVFTSASMSLDGYVAGPAESGFDHLFGWYGNGDMEVPTAQPERTFRMTGTSARHFREILSRTGALVVGRRLFDLTNGWDGVHPLGVPVVVLSHRPPPEWVTGGSMFTFVSGGIGEAVRLARGIAGTRDVGVNAGTVARQCLDAGLLDEIWVDLVPVLLGAGVPFFPELTAAPVELDGPMVIEGDHVTHLRYTLRGRSG
jgi:dihydrofolate reductase